MHCCLKHAVQYKRIVFELINYIYCQWPVTGCAVSRDVIDSNNLVYNNHKLYISEVHYRLSKAQYRVSLEHCCVSAFLQIIPFNAKHLQLVELFC